MSLIPFILDLADELQDFQRCFAAGCNAMDVDDTDFGLYPLHEAATLHHSQQQQQQQQDLQQQQQQSRRPRLLSQLYWQPNILQKQHHHRHHPYPHGRLCCNGKEKEGDKLSAANTLVGLANKRTAYPLIKKNGWVMVSMNVKQFTPDELIVKTVDNCIIIEGRHEDKEDVHGVISRHFIRKYLLPKGYDPNDVVSTLSSDGILTVKAPPPAPPKPHEEGTVRIVDIQQTGPTHSAAKDTTASGAESYMELPKTPIDTSMEQDIVGEAQELEEQTEIAMETESDVVAQKSAFEGTDLAEDVSLLEQVEQGNYEEDKDGADEDSTESNSCVGIDIAKASVVAKPTAVAVENLAESANPTAATTEETDLDELSVASVTPKSAGIIATAEESDTIVNNGGKTDVDGEHNVGDDAAADADVDADGDADGDADAEIDDIACERNEKNGELATEQVPIVAAVVLPPEIPAALGKEVCVSKGVVIEPTTADVDGVCVGDGDADNGIDTNGKAADIETLTNVAEELVAN